MPSNATRQTTCNACADGHHGLDCSTYAPDGRPCACTCNTTPMPSNTTDRNQNTRQTAQDEASAVRGLAKHNQDYWRLPKALQAIVDAFSDLDDANDHMSEADVAALCPDMAGQAPDDHMLYELRTLVEHTMHELRRHGVIEGALAWLASHPEGWDDEPDQAEDAGDAPDDEGESVRTRDCHGCKRQFQPGDLCEQWAHTFSSAAPVRSLCADCSWPAAPAKRLKDGGYALRIGYTVPGNVTYSGDQGDDPLLHGYPREWFTGDRS